jgi:beta-1,4-mannosyl-glycoprotein beta-1,4-N-acetylglucosaminyltransferase
MAKIIDSFLFFQELDLLEIRLEYLYEKVDNFLILEARQTFTGKIKPFNFENNKSRFEKYMDKIIYFKVEDVHDNYASIVNFLKNKNDQAHLELLDILENHTHYPKDKLHWVLDTYHREMLHIAYKKYANDDDMVLLSDLDEIPLSEILNDKSLLNQNNPIVCQQHEFMYFLNYYNNSNWLGTIFSRYDIIKNISLCTLRIDSKSTRNIVSKSVYKKGGYHFTSIGDIDDIKMKIQSWGHQEFNKKGILDRLEYNINTGQDIFERRFGTEMERIEFTNTKIFDSKMGRIASKYNNISTAHDIINVKEYSVYNIFRKGKSKLFIFISKINSSVTNKINRLLTR